MASGEAERVEKADREPVAFWVTVVFPFSATIISHERPETTKPEGASTSFKV